MSTTRATYMNRRETRSMQSSNSKKSDELDKGARSRLRRVTKAETAVVVDGHGVWRAAFERRSTPGSLREAVSLAPLQVLGTQALTPNCFRDVYPACFIHCPLDTTNMGPSILSISVHVNASECDFPSS
jgi:hypothetical protein